MGIRQSINENPIITSVITGLILTLAIVFIGYQACRTGPAAPFKPKQFFSVDDGATWFTDDAAKLPPFDHEGKEAYRARVFRCPDGKMFVARLERYPPVILRKIDEASKRPLNQRGNDWIALQEEYEIKKPGAKTWIPLADGTDIAMFQPKCSDGSRAQPMMPK